MSYFFETVLISIAWSKTRLIFDPRGAYGSG